MSGCFIKYCYTEFNVVPTFSKNKLSRKHDTICNIYYRLNKILIISNNHHHWKSQLDVIFLHRDKNPFHLFNNVKNWIEFYNTNWIEVLMFPSNLSYTLSVTWAIRIWHFVQFKFSIIYYMHIMKLFSLE